MLMSQACESHTRSPSDISCSVPVILSAPAQPCYGLSHVLILFEHLKKTLHLTEVTDPSLPSPSLLACPLFSFSLEAFPSSLPFFLALDKQYRSKINKNLNLKVNYAFAVLKCDPACVSFMRAVHPFVGGQAHH